MPQPLWQRLIALVDSDQKIHSFEARRAELLKQLSTHQALVTAAQNQADLALSAKEKAELRVKAIESDVAHLEKRNKELNRSLDACRNPRELKALESEQLALNRRHIELEDEIISAWHHLEGHTSELKKATEHLSRAHAEYAHAEQTISAELEQVAADEQVYETAIGDLVAGLPPEWQARYKALRGRVHNPIVPLLSESCSACYQYVLPGDLQRIKRGAVLPCNECHRYLYDPAQRLTREQSVDPQPADTLL